MAGWADVRRVDGAGEERSTAAGPALKTRELGRAEGSRGTVLHADERQGWVMFMK
jgi:hypothetical protein